MHDLSFPVLDTPAKCAALWPRYPQKVVGMWATGMPRQNVDVLWRLREELLKLGVPVVFFFKGSAPCRTPAEMLTLAARSVKRLSRLAGLAMWLHDVRCAECAENPKMWLLFLRRALLSPPDGDSPAEVARAVDAGLAHTLNELPLAQSVGLLRHCLRKDPQLAAGALLMAATSVHVTGYHKKRALFFLLLEARECAGALGRVNELAQKMPQHFSRPVLDRLNRFLPLAMKLPLPARRLAARAAGLKKPLAKNYWAAHRALS